MANFKRLQLDGVLLSISKEREKLERWEDLRDFPMPLLLFDRNIAKEELPSIHINNRKAAFLATQHLIEQGCKSLLHLGGNESLTIFRDRLRGFEKAVDASKDTSAHVLRNFDPRNEDSNEAFNQLMEQDSSIDGILAHGDISALHAIQLLEEAGRKIPEDVAVVGFGNSRFCSFVRPALSSVDQANETLGKLAAQKLLEQLSGEKGKMESQILPAELVVRGSSLR